MWCHGMTSWPNEVSAWHLDVLWWLLGKNTDSESILQEGVSTLRQFHCKIKMAPLKRCLGLKLVISWHVALGILLHAREMGPPEKITSFCTNWVTCYCFYAMPYLLFLSYLQQWYLPSSLFLPETVHVFPFSPPVQDGDVLLQSASYEVAFGCDSSHFSTICTSKQTNIHTNILT